MNERPTPSVVRALLLSIVCPGMGEWYTGRRTLGAAMITAFAAAAVWLMVGFYGATQDLSERVKQQDPTLAVQPEDAGAMVALLLRLYPAILAEYHKDSVRIHGQVSGPLGLIFVLYIASLAAAVYLARRPLAPPPPPPGPFVAPSPSA